MGASARDMLAGLIEGASTAAELAQLTRTRLQSKRAALTLALEGNFTPHHALLVQRLLIQERAVRQQSKALEQAIERQLTPADQAALALWDTIPGVNRRVGAVLAAELGIEAKQFADARHAASWVGLCPGNHESAGKQHSGKTRKGNHWLRTALVEAAWAAARSKDTYLSALYARLVPRKGQRRALVAVAHSILVSAYQMLKTGQPYRELGADYFARLRPERTVRRLVNRLFEFGYHVELSRSDGTAPPTAE